MVKHRNPLRNIQLLLNNARNQDGNRQSLHVLSSLLGVDTGDNPEHERNRIVYDISRRCRIVYESLEFIKQKFSVKDLETVTYEPSITRLQDIFSVYRLQSTWNSHPISAELVSNVGILADVIKNDIICIDDNHQEEVLGLVKKVEELCDSISDDALKQIITNYISDMREILALWKYTPAHFVTKVSVSAFGELYTNPTYRNAVSSLSQSEQSPIVAIRNTMYEVANLLATTYGAYEGGVFLIEKAETLLQIASQ